MLSPTLSEGLERYLRHLKYERNLSPKTLDNYRRQISHVGETLGLSDWSELDTPKVKKLLLLARKEDLSPRSIALRLSALRSFCQYLFHRGVLNANPASSVQAPKQGKPLPKQLNVDEVNQLLSFDPDSDIAIRDRAMFELTYGCGLRLAEISGLNLSDLQGRGQIRVTGKGSKQRLVPVGKTAQQWMSEWLKVRPGLILPGEQAVFVSKRRRRISHRQIAKRLELWAKQQDLAQAVNPHKLRHSYATHMLESSGDLRAVQELLGHANLSTTQVYTHLDFQHLTKVYDQAHPRAKKVKE